MAYKHMFSRDKSGQGFESVTSGSIVWQEKCETKGHSFFFSSRTFRGKYFCGKPFLLNFYFSLNFDFSIVMSKNLESNFLVLNPCAKCCTCPTINGKKAFSWGLAEENVVTITPILTRGHSPDMSDFTKQSFLKYLLFGP